MLALFLCPIVALTPYCLTIIPILWRKRRSDWLALCAMLLQYLSQISDADAESCDLGSRTLQLSSQATYRKHMYFPVLRHTKASKVLSVMVDLVPKAGVPAPTLAVSNISGTILEAQYVVSLMQTPSARTRAKEYIIPKPGLSG